MAKKMLKDELDQEEPGKKSMGKKGKASLMILLKLGAKKKGKKNKKSKKALLDDEDET